MELNLTDAIAIIAVLVAGASAIYARGQANAAKAALLQQNEFRLFEAFAECSEHLIAAPELLISVHGCPEESCGGEEGKAIAYLCSVIDAFQLFYDKKYSGNFALMESELKETTNFLTKILIIPRNRDRLELIRKHFYGKFDQQFFDSLALVSEFYAHQGRHEA